MRENVWAWQPWRPVNIRDGRGPERVVHEGPDKPEFAPRPAGFTADIGKTVEPSLWEGDQA